MMRRLICLLLVLLVLSGCTASGNAGQDSVIFYYARSHSGSNVYDDYYSEGIIGSEKREASGHRDNLSYLLTVYFRGPLNTELASPFPAGCRILDIQQNNGQLTILLNSVLAEKSEVDVTVACACLAMTCLELADADTVLIESRDLEEKVLFSRTFTRDNLFLRDDYTQPVESTETTQ